MRIVVSKRYLASLFVEYNFGWYRGLVDTNIVPTMLRRSWGFFYFKEVKDIGVFELKETSGGLIRYHI